MVPQIRPAELKALLDAGEAVYLLDVRQPDEFAICQLPGAVLVPLGELASRLDDVDPPAGARVVVYCHHGVRSQTGVKLLARKGIAAQNLAGGIDAWSLGIDPAVRRY